MICRERPKLFRLGFNILTEHWMQELQFAYVSGFYIHNTDDIEPRMGKGRRPILSASGSESCYDLRGFDRV